MPGRTSLRGVTETVRAERLSSADAQLLDAYWRAANYLSVGQTYLYDNPLLKEPLKKEHVKPRLVGHWGTTPGKQQHPAKGRSTRNCCAKWTPGGARRITCPLARPISTTIRF